VHWQRVATSDRREIFDAGLDLRLPLRPALALRSSVHIVHQGGQVSSVGAVADSATAAIGFETGGPVGPLDRLSLEGSAVLSRHVPDRARRSETALTGLGTFVRVAVEDGGWRAHGILWRADDFVKAEGDAHYQVLRLDGTRYRALRDYAEAGLTRTVDLAPRSFLEISARWHRVENDYEYSFRILAVARFRTKVIGD
jgi:hypothetical protein